MAQLFGGTIHLEGLAVETMWSAVPLRMGTFRVRLMFSACRMTIVSPERRVSR